MAELRGNRPTFSRSIEVSVSPRGSSRDGDQATNMPTFLPPFPGEYQRPGPGDVKRTGEMRGRAWDPEI